MGPFKQYVRQAFDNQRTQKWARRPKATAPTFGQRPKAATSICQKPTRNYCSNGPRSCRDHFQSTCLYLFSIFLISITFSIQYDVVLILSVSNRTFVTPSVPEAEQHICLYLFEYCLIVDYFFNTILLVHHFICLEPDL